MFQIFCDFDNTITNRDTTDAILNRFADKEWLTIETLYGKQLLSAKECMASQISLLDTDIQSLISFLQNNITLVDGFLPFLQLCQDLDYPFTIVSDGLDFVIKLILSTYNIHNITYYSNHLKINPHSYELEFPNEDKQCIAKLGCCKCNVVNKRNQPIGKNKIVYIGDGSSDFCVTSRKADYIFAKDSLASYCRLNNIQFFRFTNFFDIINQFQVLRSKKHVH